jgi:hypothetical protein
MKIRIALITILIMLAFVVPFSSRYPDAVQRVLGLPGGVESAAKVFGGILATALVVMFIAWGLRKAGGRR